MWLRRVDGQRLKATLSPAAAGPRVRPRCAVRDALAHDPGRGRVPARSTSRTSILNLNEPNALGDVSWFTPHKYVGIWWSLHLDTESWGSGPRHGATTANAQPLHRLRRGERLPRRARRGLEPRLGRRLVRGRQRVQLHGAVPGLRPRGGRRAMPASAACASSAITRPRQRRALRGRSSAPRSTSTRGSGSTASRPATSPTPAASVPSGPTAGRATSGTTDSSCRVIT